MTLDPEKFDINERDGLRLITPARGTMGLGNAPWTRETLPYRSRVETLDGKVVSQGFKKFFNLSSGPTELQVTLEDIIKAIEHRDAVATLKLDGSLLVRAVHQGKVYLRTRGSFGYEFLDNADEMEEFKTRYPAIFNPSILAGYSVLFEWTSPKNVIVLKYDKPELTLIGAIEHTRELPYVTLRHNGLSFIATLLSVPLIQYFPLDTEGFAKLQLELEASQEIEGYVIRLHNEQTLVKVKCQAYLTKHGLKSTLTSEKLADMWFQQGQPDYKTFCNTFLASFDEETLFWAMGAISSLFDGVKEYNAILDHMRTKVFQRSSWDRKKAALAGLNDYGQTKRFALYMNLWEGKASKGDLLKSILLQSTKQVEIGMFKPTEAMGD